MDDGVHSKIINKSKIIRLRTVVNQLNTSQITSHLKVINPVLAREFGLRVNYLRLPGERLWLGVVSPVRFKFALLKQILLQPIYIVLPVFLDGVLLAYFSWSRIS